MIEVRHLCVSFKEKQVLDDVSFTLPKGKIIMVLGENGSGKTTLFKTILQQIKKHSGCILKEKEDCQGWSEKKRAEVFSYVPQIKEVVQGMRVEECIVSGLTRTLSLFGVPKAKEYAEVDALLERFGFTHLKGKALEEISGGELQMVYVLRALLQKSEVMLMDEPCTYLDFHKQHFFLEEIKRMMTKDTSVLISIHDPNLAFAYGDEILVLHKGKLHAHLKKEEGNMAERCCSIYNEIYGEHFYLDSEKKQMLWKEDICCKFNNM